VSVDDLTVAGNVIATRLPAPGPELHAWWSDFAWQDVVIAAAQHLLSAAERERAARFGTAELRARYVAGRATLRLLLGQYLGMAGEDVPLARARRGRPVLQLADAPDFNVSHTRDAALFAIAPSARIGVDLERRDRSVDAAMLSRKFLTAHERQAMNALPAGAQREYFLRLWTCKEAMSKATGDGLSAPLSRMSVSAEGRRLALADGPPPYVTADWRLLTIDVPDTHVATAALWRPSGGATAN
jgi:4'-phosphopantetheinyl transferase